MSLSKKKTSEIISNLEEIADFLNFIIKQAKNNEKYSEVSKDGTSSVLGKRLDIAFTPKEFSRLREIREKCKDHIDALKEFEMLLKMIK